MHIELLHSRQNLFLEFLLTGIPREWQGSTPPFEVVHLPPGQERRTGDKLPDLLFRVAQFQEHIAPDALFTDDGQRQVDAVQRHPVDLLFPTRPIPEGHGIRESAVVEVVPQGQIGLVAFFLSHSRHHGGQLGLHLVP